MFLILKLILIISIHKTYANITQDSEIILLPTWKSTEAKEVPLIFKTFGKLMQLNLRKYDQIISPVFEIWKNNKNNVVEKLSKLKTSNSCFYIHENLVSFATINICQEHGLEGFLFVKNYLLEIRPLQNMFAPSSFNDYCVKEQTNESFGKPHLIKRSLQYFSDSNFNDLHKIRSTQSYVDIIPKEQHKFTIELAVFVDAKAYNSMMKLFLSFEEMLSTMLVYVSRIQALYHHPSLGVQIDISLVRLEFMETQPPNLSTYNNDSSNILSSFCAYASNLNPESDNDPRHWDIALYITGLQIIKIERYSFFGQPYTIYHGQAYQNQACSNWRYSCAFVTLSSDKHNNFDDTYFYSDMPYKIRERMLTVDKLLCIYAYNNKIDSTKLNIISRLSIYLYNSVRFEEKAEHSSVTAAHEIGHVLGLKHPSTESCKASKYIMCPGEKQYKENEWSLSSRILMNLSLENKWCLKDQMQHDYLDSLFTYASNTLFHSQNLSGRKRTAKKQCESLLHDENANVITLHDICQYLQCESSHKTYLFPGSTLQGTHCSYKKECRNGDCVSVIEPPYNFHYCERDNWSEWKEDTCKSSCLEKSKGIVVRRRSCKHRTRKTANCAGPYYDTVLCNDLSLCALTHQTMIEFTTKKCFEFAKYANITFELLIASAIQMPHNNEKPWLACTIFCRRKDTPDLYTARENMFNHSVDPYFPDGTWCHNKDEQDYFCRQHYCLPDNYSFVESRKCRNNY